MIQPFTHLTKGAARRLLSSSARPTIQESRAAIIGGSIGGCAAAIALQRAGVSSIDVFERSLASDLADRGLGIGLPKPIFQQLVENDMLDSNMKRVETERRQWILKYDKSYKGKILFQPPMEVQLHNWGLLWKQLRKRVNDSSYHSGIAVNLDKTKLNQGNKLELFDEKNQSLLGEYDMCIQAHGALAGSGSDNTAKYAGYVLWRGSFPVKDHPSIDLENMPETFFTPVFENGHGIFYLMPTSSASQGDYLMNFAIYTHTPPGLQGDYLYKVTRAEQVTSEQLSFFQDVAVSQMPPRFQDIVNVVLEQKSISFHPILDRIPDSFVTMDGQGLLLGDAGTVLRPHTASGSTKAVLEALLLQKLIQSADATWETVTQAYQADRQSDAESKVSLGERLGRAQVLETPDWKRMASTDFEDWLAAQVSDSGNYMYKFLKKKK